MDGKFDVMIAVDGELDGFAGGAADPDAVLEPGVVDIHAEGFPDRLFKRIEHGQQAALGAAGIHVEHPVEIPGIGAPTMDEIGFEQFAMFLEPLHPAGDDVAGAVGVEEARAAVTGLDTEGEVADQHAFVVIEMLVEGFDGGGGTAALVLGEGNEHPTHAGKFLPGTVIDVLAGVDDLLGAGKGPVDLAIAHAGLGGAGEEIMVGNVQVESLGAAPAIEVGDAAPLVPAGVFEGRMAGMMGGGAGIAGIGAVVFEQGEPAFPVELVEAPEIIGAPLAAQAGGIAERGLLSGRHDDVVAAAHGAGGEQGITADLNAPAAGVGGKGLGLGEGGGRFVLHVEPAAETEDEHLESDGGALFDGVGDGGAIGGDHVHHQGILGGPWCDGPVQATHGETGAFAVEAVVGKDPGAERFEGLARGDGLGGTEIGTDFEEAGGFLLVVDLGVEIGIGEPSIGSAIGAGDEHAAEGHVGFDMDVGRKPAFAEFVDFGEPFDGGEKFAGIGVEADGAVGGIGDGDPLGVAGQTVVEFVMDGDPDAACGAGIRTLEVESEGDSGRGPGGTGVVMTDPFPGEAFGGFASLETDELEGGGIVGEGADPFGAEEGVVGLALQTADFETLAVEGDDSFGFDAAQDRFTRDEVVEGDGGGVGLDAEDAADEPIGQFDLTCFGAGQDLGRVGGGIQEPIDRCRRPQGGEGTEQEDQGQPFQPTSNHPIHDGAETSAVEEIGRGNSWVCGRKIWFRKWTPGGFPRRRGGWGCLADGNRLRNR